MFVFGGPKNLLRLKGVDDNHTILDCVSRLSINATPVYCMYYTVYISEK